MTKQESKSSPATGSDLISLTIENMDKVLAGLGAEIKDKGILQNIGLLAQQIRGYGLFKGLAAELQTLIEAGTIKSDYLETPQYLDCLQEILKFLDEDIPDEARFNALKAIFLVAASEQASSRDEVLPHQYMRLCKKLSSGAVLVMLTEYRVITSNKPEGSFPRSLKAKAWQDNIAKEAGLKHAEMVALFDQDLVKINILSPLGPSDISFVKITERGRLTDLGWGLCEFIAYSDRFPLP